MKISKERLQQIIKEEFQRAEKEENQPTDPQKKPDDVSADSKQAMAKKLKQLALVFPKAEGIDKVEIQLLDKLIVAAIKASNDDNAKQVLVLALKKLGVEI